MTKKFIFTCRTYMIKSKLHVHVHVNLVVYMCFSISATSANVKYNDALKLYTLGAEQTGPGVGVSGVGVPSVGGPWVAPGTLKAVSTLPTPNV